ncbi:MAG: hypothetical protein ACYTGB_02560 [Planctomycetota bacterium]|jgi:hypothetical protein
MDIPDKALNAAEIEKSIDELCVRISERFPSAGLGRTCRTLHGISRETQETLEWISRPNQLIRWSIVAVLGLLGAVLIVSVAQLDFGAGMMTVTDFVQITEAALNEIVLIGAGVIFLVTIENRRRRKRVVAAVNRLRRLAHVVDAHQLTKDPDSVPRLAVPTEHSPKRTLDEVQLGRYLNYCTEMLSLIGKLGFLYVQDFDDPAANGAVNDLEILTTGLSRKIWQKIMILDSRMKTRTGRGEG